MLFLSLKYPPTANIMSKMLAIAKGKYTRVRSLIVEASHPVPSLFRLNPPGQSVRQEFSNNINGEAHSKHFV